MYLLNLSNLDYILMTVLFGLIISIAYYFRRKNTNSGNYLVAEKISLNKTWISIGRISIGLPEFIFFSASGAYFGLSIVWVLVPIFIFVAIMLDKIIIRSRFFEDLNNYQHENYSNYFITVFYSLFMLMVAGAAIMMMVTLFKSLLGWEFGNSTLSLMAFIAISMLIGGFVSILYNQGWTIIIYFAIIFATIVIGINHLGVAGVVDGLHNIEFNNKMASNELIKPFLNLQYYWLIILSCTLLLIINPLSYLKQQKNLPTNTTKLSRFGQLILIVVIILTGVLSLATPSNKPTLNNGNKIVTQQTRLEDGSVGYIVKSVNNNTPTPQKGLVPLLMSNKNIIDSFDSSQSIFDYSSSGLVLVKAIFPYAFVMLFMIVLLFYKTISETVFFATVASIRGIYALKHNKTKEDLENLWAARVFMFMFFIVAICIGLVFYRFFDIYYVGALLLISSMPILFNLLNLSISFIVDLIVITMSLSAFLFLNINNVPSLYEIIKFANFIDFVSVVTLVITVFYIVTFILAKLFRVKENV